MPLLEMKEMTKSFGNVVALEKASFELDKGEVHALLGANGAGKSTLIKILSGAYEYSEGDITLEGKTIAIRSPRDAKNHGIYCVYQEVDTVIVPQLTVAENILLDTFSTEKRLFINKRKLREKAASILKLLNVTDIPMTKQALELSLAEKQLVLIARALAHEAKVIIFDEPTAPLSIEETKHLFEIVETLKEKGVGCIFISHRLPEVFEICDRLTIMRDGKTITTLSTKEVTQKTVVETMLGNSYTEQSVKQKAVVGDLLLEVNGLEDGEKLKDISFTVSEGEIVGVVGLVGAGKTELAKTLFGLRPHEQGEVKVKGNAKKFTHSQQAIEAGLALISEERRKEGLFIHESISTNLSFANLKKFSPLLFMNRKGEKSHAKSIIELLGIKADNTETLAEHLSGGNQQKVAIGKWVSRNASLYLFDEPTKGVDVGAKQDIFKLIHSLADEGKGILYFSCEIDEIIRISDRILVMYDGEIVKELSREEATQDKILLYASGGKEDVHEREYHQLPV
ncbi:sugar ABC transporter ATP-binding protein [Bacillus sinesaloumensis]|uniref:sugar ABC transporter ATP-binding protein n=1 Tax=Litchfieldia sinesaloumensis TaxID=1926280 RepID=UPI00098840D2|nr:sugar ABC transporter ATP-binding protein [Bacillus sinesaloumensis]